MKGLSKNTKKLILLYWLIVLGFNDMSTLWVILCRLPEKGRKEIDEIGEETAEIKTFPHLYSYLLQGQQALPNCKPISVGRLGDISYMTPLPHPTTSWYFYVVYKQQNSENLASTIIILNIRTDRPEQAECGVWSGFFFYLGFTALSRIFHLYRAYRSSKVGENRRTRRKTTWPSVSRTWLSHIWPERGSNHSGEKPNGLRVNSLIHCHSSRTILDISTDREVQ